MLRVGDKVRFLNEVGGGDVVRIDAKTGLVYVEDQDGFEIPVLPQECVVVNTINKNNFPEAPKAKPEVKVAAAPVVDKYVPTVQARSESVYETAEGDTLRAVVAFVPQNIKELQTTKCDCLLINDSNYFVYYNVATLVDGQAESVASGLIEPNMQEVFYVLPKEELNDWANFRVQLLPFKQGKKYKPQGVLDSDVQLNVVKFYKLHSYRKNEYMDDEAILVDLIEAKNAKRLEQVSAASIREAMMVKEDVAKPKKQRVERQQPEILEVDLHIDRLLDSTAGMNRGAILVYQMEVFHQTIAENKGKRGQKIVFIHGKGEGVLRKEIEKALRHRYKEYEHQDASFREYGFGATMVVIR